MDKKALLTLLVILILNCLSLAQSLRGEEAKRWQEALGLAQSGKADQALAAFKNILERRPEPGLFIQAGNFLIRQGEAARAEELFIWGRRKLKQPRAFADRLADIYQSQQKYDRAVAEWCRLLPEQSDLVESKLNEIAQYLGWSKAAALAESAMEPEAGDQGRSILVGLYLKAGDGQRAERIYTRIKDKKQLNRAGQRFLNAGVRPETQARVLEEYLSRTGYQEAEVMERLAAIYMGDKNYRKAAAVYDRLIMLSRPRALVLKARAELAQSRPQEAIEILAGLKEWKQGAGVDSLMVEARFITAEARFILGEDGAALALWRSMAYDSILGLNYQCRASYRLGEHFLGAGEVDSALAYYRRTAKLGLAGELGNDALMRLLLISESRSATIEGLKLFGRGLADKNRTKLTAAASWFAQVQREYPGTVLSDQAMLELSLMYQEAGEMERAVETWGRLASGAVDPLLACRAAYQQGWLLKHRLNRPEKAAEIFKQAILKYPDYSWSDLMRRELEDK